MSVNQPLITLALAKAASNGTNWTAVAAWAAWATAGIYVVLGLFAWRQVHEARKLREEQARPFVIVDFEPGWLVYLTVENLSRGLACFPDNGLDGFAGACLQGSCGRVVGEGDPAAAQVPDHVLCAGLGTGVGSAPAASHTADRGVGRRCVFAAYHVSSSVCLFLGVGCGYSGRGFRRRARTQVSG
jgi:hypothetical protein